MSKTEKIGKVVCNGNLITPYERSHPVSCINLASSVHYCYPLNSLQQRMLAYESGDGARSASTGFPESSQHGKLNSNSLQRRESRSAILRPLYNSDQVESFSVQRAGCADTPIRGPMRSQQRCASAMGRLGSQRSSLPSLPPWDYSTTKTIDAYNPLHDKHLRTFFLRSQSAHEALIRSGVVSREGGHIVEDITVVTARIRLLEKQYLKRQQDRERAIEENRIQRIREAAKLREIRELAERIERARASRSAKAKSLQRRIANQGKLAN